MKNQALLMCLLALTTTYAVECLPIKIEDVRENNEIAEERTIVYDPTVDTDFTIKVGDITYFTKNYRELLNEKLSYKESSQGKQKRAVVKPKSWQWPNCVIPYIIDEFYYEKQQRVVTEALAHWEEHTCVRFMKRTTEDNYIFIYPGPGCGSYVGRTSNQQRVSIGPSCFSFSSAVHELGHVIGFYHEHNRPDRDEYIDIIENNLKPGRSVLSQFTKLSHDEVDLLGVGYDYNSIMHYNKNSFAHSSHLDTIVALDPSIPVGEAHTLSSLDILRANLFCKCSNSTEDHPPRTTFVPDEIVSEPTLPPHEFACGSVFDGVSSGSFSSPEYGVYSHDTDCEWTIRVEEGYRIRFTVELDMDYNQGCVNDYLHIHENFNRNGYGIGKYCQSSDRIINTYTTTNIAYIRFHTDSSNQRAGLKGFNLTFESEDFDECAYGAYCSHNCTNFPGSYECHCPKGFFLSSDHKQCFDVNECALDKGGCDHKCINKGGSFHCVCEDGYRLLSDGKTCVVDADGTMDPCLITKCEHSCVVVPGDVLTARCLCPKGYDLSSDRVSCDEENECLARNGGCQHFCTNIPGSYECSCIKGYKLADNGFTCEDADDTVDPCLIANCEHSCEVVPGDVDTARCLCPKGYDLSSNRVSCDEVNECLTRNGGCQDLCTNVPGSYECSCSKGYKLADNGLTCEDDTMDPCLIANCEHSCEVVSGDVDTARCLCPKGYYLSSDRVSCDEVNECLTRNGGCQHLCTNVPGSYECNCSKGYKLADNGLTCEDIDECMCRQQRWMVCN
ncbi:multiple epidermal growth factor-like domains protein 6 [Halichondria panicea]|uniref:multiple epidermal growth factor-like domains protein 6 n=1 Tax=Halichondria panicea TaxID=6063 RepID=UPI00312BA2D1